MLLMAMIVLIFWFWFCTDYITTVLIKWSQSINENHNLSCQGETKAKDVFFQLVIAIFIKIRNRLYIEH